MQEARDSNDYEGRIGVRLSIPEDLAPAEPAPSLVDLEHKLADVVEFAEGDPDCWEGFWDAVHDIREARRAAREAGGR